MRTGAVVLVAVALLLLTGQQALAWQDARAVSPDWTDRVHGARWALVWAAGFTMLAYRRFRRSDILS